MSENPSQRLKDHNRSKVKSTKAFIPWKIVMIKQAGDISRARNLEKYYKAAGGKRKIKALIKKSPGSLPD